MQLNLALLHLETPDFIRPLIGHARKTQRRQSELQNLIPVIDLNISTGWLMYINIFCFCFCFALLFFSFCFCKEWESKHSTLWSLLTFVSNCFQNVFNAFLENMFQIILYISFDRWSLFSLFLTEWYTNPAFISIVRGNVFKQVLHVIKVKALR